MSPVTRGIQQLVRRAFDIRKGEFRIAFFLQAYIFLIISVLLIVKPTVTALFIDSFGVDELPRAYVVVAIVAVIGSLWYGAALESMPLIKLIMRTLWVSSLVMLVAGVMLAFGWYATWVLYIFYVWISIFAVLSASQFWIMANVVFNVREAKRIFSFIGAGAIAGGIFGGYITSLLVPFTGSIGMIAIASALLIACIPLAGIIWKRSAAKYTVFRRRKRTIGFGRGPLKAVLQHRLLWLLAGIVGISVLVAKLVDYQFSDYAARAMPSSDALAGFFGFWLSSLNLVSLLVQVFLTQRVVGTWGVGTSLLLLPLGIAVASVLLIAFPELWAVVLLKSIDGSLKQSVNKSAVELLSLPIPFDLKNRTKTFIDVVVDSVATGVAGLLLILFVNGFDWHAEEISAVVLVLIVIWLVMAYRIRLEYLRAFVQMETGEKTVAKTSRPAAPLSSVVGSVRRVLASGTDSQIIYMLGKTLEYTDVRFYASFLPLLKHENAEIRSLALQNLYFFPTRPIPAQDIDRLMVDPDARVKQAAFEYMFRDQGPDKILRLESFLTHHDPHISGSALIALAKEAKSSFTLRARAELIERVKRRESYAEQIQDEALRQFEKQTMIQVMCEMNEPEFYPFIHARLQDPDPVVRNEAIRAAGRLFSSQVIPDLIALLADRDYREEARNALAYFGVAVVDALVTEARQGSYGTEALRHLPSVMERFQSKRAVRALVQLLDHDDTSLRLEAMRALIRLRQASPSLRVNKSQVFARIHEESTLYWRTLEALHTQIIIDFHRQQVRDPEATERIRLARKSLVQLLEHRLEANLERIFTLLGLHYPVDDVLRIYEVLRGSEADAKLKAIEFLDNLLDPQLKPRLIPVVEVAIMDSLAEESIRSLQIRAMGEEQCYRELLHGRDTKARLAVLFLLEQMADKRYQELVASLLSDPNFKVRDFAQRTLDAITRPEA